MHDSSNSDHHPRQLFVAFLQRFAEGDVDREQREQLVVNHYVDTTLERIRQECVGIRMKNEAMHWSTEEHGRIQAWIHVLRTAAE